MRTEQVEHVLKFANCKHLFFLMTKCCALANSLRIFLSNLGGHSSNYIPFSYVVVQHPFYGC